MHDAYICDMLQWDRDKDSGIEIKTETETETEIETNIDTDRDKAVRRYTTTKVSLIISPSYLFGTGSAHLCDLLNC
jgi:hypothetical protein